MLLAPALALAGGMAVIESGDGSDFVRSTIEFRDDQLRLSMAQAEMEGYMLMRDGGLYAVTDQNGEPFVMDLGAMFDMMGELFDDQLAIETPITNLISVESTGRTEQVAGITGQVYQVTYRDDEQDEVVTQEVVIGNHPALRELSRSLETWSRALAERTGTGASDYNVTMNELLTRGDGVLRMGDFYRLVSLSSDTPAAARFELPAPPAQMPNIGALMSEAMQGAQEAMQGAQTSPEPSPQPQESSAGNGGIGGFFDRRVRRQQERVEDRTDQEVERAADRAVDRALDSIFRRF